CLRPEAQDCEIEHLLEAPSSWTVIFDNPIVRNELSTVMTTPDDKVWCLKPAEGEKLGGIEVKKDKNDGIRVEKSQPKAPTYQESAEMGQKDKEIQTSSIKLKYVDDDETDDENESCERYWKDAEDYKLDRQFDSGGPCYQNERRLENESFPPKQFRGYNASS
ncbi:13110_t:CDS:2, partial [Racocetra fulgida]